MKMGITLQDFIDMAIDNYYDCYVWDNENEWEHNLKMDLWISSIMTIEQK